MGCLLVGYDLSFFFFFQAEDGIRDYKVTGVQTCALQILRSSRRQITCTGRTPAQRSSAGSSAGLQRRRIAPFGHALSDVRQCLIAMESSHSYGAALWHGLKIGRAHV